MTPIFQGKIENNQIKLNEPDKVKLHIQSLNGQDIDYIIQKHKKERSNQENKYYWSVIIPYIMDLTGYDSNETHEAIKLKFLKKEKFINNDEVSTIASTAKLSTSEFEDLMSNIRIWAASEHNCYIPLPNECVY